MLGLRIAFGLFAGALFAATILRYRRRKISRLNLLITTTVSLVVILLAGFPNLLDPILNLFNFQRGGGARLIGVSLIGILVLLVLLLRTMGEADTVARDLRLLIEVLGQQSFDMEQAAQLPEGDRIVVVMPAFNEAENVGAVIREMPAEVEGMPVVPLVVDDASEDQTSTVAREAGALVARLPIRRGGGLALRVGYEIALKLGATIVASMDSDGQHLPEELKVVVAPILRDEADMVQGSRILGLFERESRVRHLGVLFFSRLVTLMTGLKVTDVSSGYRAARLETLRKLVLKQDQFWTSEVLIEGLRQRARIVEVPITIRARTSGESKKPKTFRYGWNFTKAILQTWLR